MRARQARAVSCSLAASRPCAIPSARQVMREPPDLRAKVTPRGVSLCIRLAPWCPFAHDKNCGTTSFAVYLYALLRATP